MMKLHKLERHHYYALVFITGFAFGFVSGSYFNNQPIGNSIISGFWYAFISTVFTIMGYEIGVKRRKK